MSRHLPDTGAARAEHDEAESILFLPEYLAFLRSLRRRNLPLRRAATHFASPWRAEPGRLRGRARCRRFRAPRAAAVWPNASTLPSSAESNVGAPWRRGP